MMINQIAVFKTKVIHTCVVDDTEIFEFGEFGHTSVTDFKHSDSPFLVLGAECYAGTIAPSQWFCLQETFVYFLAVALATTVFLSRATMQLAIIGLYRYPW